MSRTNHTCPGCGRDDRTQAVPAVHLAGRDAVTGTERDREGHTRTVTRTVTSALSDALSPVPRPPSYGGTLLLGVLAAFAALGTFAAGALTGGWFQAETPVDGPFGTPVPDPLPEPAGPGVLGWISALAALGTVLAAVVLHRRRAGYDRLIRDRARAERLWSRGWYCHRCATVHLDADTDRTPLGLQEFRERVWERGGYGHLAVRQRAADPVPR
ncbi:hypothetical protein [Streptomyces termitum]|uniref:hypothetical protein n=1 Tax=Streptomyces termitum TaxID=67368 RepID=UPI0033B2888D